jgi:N-acetylmuramoyl-L-alanine amidase
MPVSSWRFRILCLVAWCYAVPAAACAPADFVVAIDVGHSLQSPGAISARGVPEFQFNRKLAEALADALAVAGFDNRFVINADGQIRSLRQRVIEADRRQADLFLSIHHDSVQPHYLSTWIVDGVARKYSDRYRGFSLFVSAKNGRFADSRRFATLIGQALTARGLTPTLHHAEPIRGENRPLLDASLGLYQFDDLVVLAQATMPAVLLEAGVIVHREEERLLAQPAYRQRIAAAVVSAVRAYCIE